MHYRSPSPAPELRARWVLPRGIVALVPVVAGMLALSAVRLPAQEPEEPVVAIDPLPGASLPARTAADSLPRPRLELPADALRVAAVERIPVAANRTAVSICAGGDVAFGTNLSEGWRGSAAVRWGVSPDQLPTPHDLAGRIGELMPPADVVLLNVEGALGDEQVPPKCAPGSTACYAIRMPPESAEALRSIAPHATVIGTVANNHSRDAGAEGFAATRRLLAAADVLVTGADSLASPLVVAPGDTIGVLGFGTSPGSLTDLRDLAAVRRHVERARERYGRVIVTAHLGAEGVAAQRTSNQTEIFYGTSRGNPVAFAHSAVDAGASLVIGHGPHVLRAIEWRGNALIAYSLGNLLTFGPFSTAEPLNRGALLCAMLGADGAVQDAALVPTVQPVAGRLQRDPQLRAAALFDSLSTLDFPETGARVSPAGRVRRPPPR